jgi:hypothetical protein
MRYARRATGLPLYVFLILGALLIALYGWIGGETGVLYSRIYGEDFSCHGLCSNGSLGKNTTVQIGTVITLSPGSNVTVVRNGTLTNAILNFGIPAGENGTDGSAGADANITVTVKLGGLQNVTEYTEVVTNLTITAANGTFLVPGKTGAPGADATVAVNATTLAVGHNVTIVNVGNSSESLLEFGIPPGETGISGKMIIGTITTLPAGQNASCFNVGNASDAVYNFNLPKGGAGYNASVAVGSVSTGTAGGNVSIANVGNASDAVYDFIIAPGAKGQTGTPGELTEVTFLNGVEINSTTFNTTASEINIFVSKNITIAPGDHGPDGEAATITIINTTQGSPGSGAEVLNLGSDSAAELLIIVPQGQPGAAAVLLAGNTTYTSAGTNATVTLAGNSSYATLDFSFPNGADGTAASMVAGNTTSLSPGSNATAVNAGTSTAAIIDIALPQGTAGTNGQAPTVVFINTTQLPAGSNATVQDIGTGSAAQLVLGVPTGATGDAGTVPLISTANTTSLPAGSNATVVNVGNSTNLLLEVAVPTGETGTPGTAATISIVNTTTLPTGSSASVTNAGTSSALHLDIAVVQGLTGSAGSAATLVAGTTSTLSTGSSATVVNAGTSSAGVFNFSLPIGVTGDAGTAGTIVAGTTTASSSGASVTNVGTANAAILNVVLPVQGVSRGAMYTTSAAATFGCTTSNQFYSIFTATAATSNFVGSGGGILTYGGSAAVTVLVGYSLSFIPSATTVVQFCDTSSTWSGSSNPTCAQKTVAAGQAGVIAQQYLTPITNGHAFSLQVKCTSSVTLTIGYSSFNVISRPR